MSERPLWEISASTSVAGEEAVTALFASTFPQSPSVYLDARTGRVKVSVYHETTLRESARLRILLQAGFLALRACGVSSANTRFQVRRVRREQWAESWKRHFHPLEIGRNLLIKPSWSRRKPHPGQAVVTLDPGLSFGTGQHPTTLFCLQQIVRHRRMDRTPSLLDIGTGSGILAISAATLGYQPVRAIDFDPTAVRIAKENADTNGLGGLVKVVREDLTRMRAHSPVKFDVVCANLTADLLLSQRGLILNRIASEGTLVLAGILRSQFIAVRTAYRSEGMRLTSSRTGGEWRSGAFRRD